MKRYIKSNIDPVHVEIEIIAVLNDYFPIAASKNDVKLDARKMKLEYQLTNEQYSAYINFLSTVASIIVNQGFEVVEQYQSKESYSYYIQFTPTFYDGVLEGDVDRNIPRINNGDVVLDVKFRLSDHYKTEEDRDGVVDTDSLGRTKSAGVVFKEFVVEGVTHTRIQTVVSQIRTICNDLKSGDYSGLF